jgi:hypothetical protein
MPLIIMGLIPTIISIIIGNYILLFWGVLLIAGGGADLWICIKTSKFKNDSWIIIPESTKTIGIIYRKKDTI